MNGLKVIYEIDKLKEIVDERIRLVEVLQMHPSKNDTLQLKKHINRTLDLLKDYQEEFLPSEQEQFDSSVLKYNECLESLPDDLLDKKLYHFEKKQGISDAKKVRFKDDLVEEFPKKANTFKPYKDEEDVNEDSESLDSKRKKLFGSQENLASKYSVIPPLSNQDMFIHQQQQLMEQESHLSGLSNSISRTHGISLDINNEVDQQNEHLLTDLESRINRSDGNLNRAGRRLSSYEATAREKGSCLVILALSIILFLLLII